MSCFLMRDICFSINRMSGFLEFYVRRTNGSVRKAAYTTTMIEGKLHRCLTGIDKQTEIMPQPTKAIISNEQKSGIRKGSNRASTGKVGALLLSVYIV